MIDFQELPFSSEEVDRQVQELISGSDIIRSSKDTLIQLLSFIDLTSLEGSDTTAHIKAVCDKAKSLQHIEAGVPGVAAVCFYPPFVRLARKELEGTGMQVASVAGAFPSGQAPLIAKLEEVQYAVSEGAHEIDTVISRGKFLEGEYNFVFDEIAAIKEACGPVHLKVILETGELQHVENIYKASQLAIQAGADFIKTSTGKVQPAATLQAFYTMAICIREHFKVTGAKIGIKPAGGISTPEQAIDYLNVLNGVLGKEWMNKELFRIGASRLTDALVAGIVS